MNNIIDISLVKLHRAFNTRDYPYPELQAASLYLIRRDRLGHPDGYFDEKGRWYAHGQDAVVMAPCRSPSRHWPYSEMHSCRTLKHCARYYNADTKLTNRAARAIEHMTKGTPLPKTAEKYVPLLKAAYVAALL